MLWLKVAIRLQGSRQHDRNSYCVCGSLSGHSRMYFAFYSAECCHLVGMVSFNVFVMKKTVKNNFSY